MYDNISYFLLLQKFHSKLKQLLRLYHLGLYKYSISQMLNDFLYEHLFVSTYDQSQASTEEASPRTKYDEIC